MKAWETYQFLLASVPIILMLGYMELPSVRNTASMQLHQLRREAFEKWYDKITLPIYILFIYILLHIYIYIYMYNRVCHMHIRKIIGSHSINKDDLHYLEVSLPELLKYFHSEKKNSAAASSHCWEKFTLTINLHLYLHLLDLIKRFGN